MHWRWRGSEMVRCAIVFPLAWNNYVWKAPNVKMFPYEAMISPHIQYIKKHGAIYFDANWEINVQTPVTGYIYIGVRVPDAPQEVLGKIGYKVTIEKILTRDQLMNQIQREYEYVPFWRQQCLDGIWPSGSPYAGQEHEPSATWLKLTNIKKLVPPLDISEVGLGRPPRRGVKIDKDIVKDKVEVLDADIDVNDTKTYQLRTYQLSVKT